VKHGVDVTESPQRTAAVNAAYRFERETPAHPPPPIDSSDYHLARQHLSQNPIASLCLGVMSDFAA
jgi:hypothetical protein